MTFGPSYREFRKSEGLRNQESTVLSELSVNLGNLKITVSLIGSKTQRLRQVANGKLKEGHFIF